MNETQTVIAFCGLLVAVVGLLWRIGRSLVKKRPKVIVTKDGMPGADAELVADDGAQFAISAHTGCAYPAQSYIGALFFVRNRRSRKELARFILKAGLNEVVL